MRGICYIFSEEKAKLFAKRNCGKCYGRGFYIGQSPTNTGIWKEEKRYCKCVFNNVKRNWNNLPTSIESSV